MKHHHILTMHEHLVSSNRLLIPFRLLSTHQFSTSLISDSPYHLTRFTLSSFHTYLRVATVSTTERKLTLRCESAPLCSSNVTIRTQKTMIHVCRRCRAVLHLWAGDVHHPLNAELVGTHPKRVAPGGFLERHDHPAAGRKL